MLDNLKLDEAVKVIVNNLKGQYDDGTYMIDWYRNGATLLGALVTYTDSHIEMDETGWRILLRAEDYITRQIDDLHNRTGEFA